MQYLNAKTRILQQAPLALPGFEHINRYWDTAHHCYAAKLLPGEYYVTREQEMIVTVLGSCVSACVRDAQLCIGGMNHFMLPINAQGSSGSWEEAGLAASTRYGNFAMEKLINDILKLGGRRQNLEIKIFGGGRILDSVVNIGRLNIEFVYDYIRTEGMNLLSQDVGDICPRKVYYLPSTGQVFVNKLRALHNRTIIEREVAYHSTINEKPVAGEIELF